MSGKREDARERPHRLRPLKGRQQPKQAGEEEEEEGLVEGGQTREEEQEEEEHREGPRGLMGSSSAPDLPACPAPRPLSPSQGRKD